MGHRSRVYWVVPEAGMLFWRFHCAYVEYVRPKVDSHPYYYTSIWGEEWGQPWTLEAAGDRFRRAVRSIGLEPCAARGLSMHGFRHRARHFMDRADVARRVQQIVLHQRSARSQDAYGRPEAGEVRDALAAVTRAGECDFVAGSYARAFSEVEALGRLDEIGRELAGRFLKRIP